MIFGAFSFFISFSFLYLGRDFNGTIIPLAIFGYEMVKTTRLVGYLSSHNCLN